MSIFDMDGGGSRAERRRRKREQEAAAYLDRMQAEAAADEVAAFEASQPGLARRSYERGDIVFQCAIDAADPDAVELLNAICDEGWELITGSFVFETMGQESHDRVFGSGQKFEVLGRTVGHYLFRRLDEDDEDGEDDE